MPQLPSTSVPPFSPVPAVVALASMSEGGVEGGNLTFKQVFHLLSQEAGLHKRQTLLYVGAGCEEESTFSKVASLGESRKTIF